jgi:PleD family two-component response regulator
MSTNAPFQDLTASAITAPDRRPVVVLAGGDNETRQSLRTALESWGLDIIEAGSCSQAPEVAGQCRPDLVLLDASIPFTECLEAAATLRNQSPTADIPVLVISDFRQAPFREAALAQGVADYLTKPCSPGMLHDTVLRLTDRRPARLQNAPQRIRHIRPRIRPNSVL